MTKEELINLKKAVGKKAFEKASNMAKNSEFGLMWESPVGNILFDNSGNLISIRNFGVLLIKEQFSESQEPKYIP